MAYMNRDDVAGRKFSIRGLLGKNVNRNAFLDGSLVNPIAINSKYCNEFTKLIEPWQLYQHQSLERFTLHKTLCLYMRL
ncbi:unnamed protein product [Brassica oleracea]